MTSSDEVITCKCGQMNRLSAARRSSGHFSCGKCGAHLKSRFVATPTHRRNVVIPLTVLGIISIAAMSKFLSNPPPKPLAAAISIPEISSYRPYLEPIPLIAELPKPIIVREFEFSTPMAVLALSRAEISSRDESLAKGKAAAASKNFKSAVSHFSNALDIDVNYVPALFRRGEVYQQTGDTAKAVADFRKIVELRTTVEDGSEAMLARQRLAKLAPETAVTSRAITSDSLLKGEPDKSTGTIQKLRRGKPLATFGIETEAGANYLVKLVSVKAESDQIIMYVRGGETYQTKVPLGNYRLRAATGDVWYGRNDLFGPATRYFRLRNKKDAESEDAQLLSFRIQGNQILGMKLSLKKVSIGNLEQEAMSRAEFEAGMAESANTR